MKSEKKVTNKTALLQNFRQLMDIPDAQGVLVQPMLKGHELFIGGKREGNFSTEIFEVEKWLPVLTSHIPQGQLVECFYTLAKNEIKKPE